ncbi:glycosyltransferase [Bacteroides sp. 214]|uniref:glycosyltransferase n=1 Tax=Bacteroides sp. 214 TaxID=2302935 RepID=UPI0013D42D9A|nr:glycosyltransferase [Bacteroides sp. 214]NDW12750.1 glycosyltransferase [Bacteroides sp. 214]
MQQSIQPKVSVIIPVYNTQEYVRQAVECVMKQSLLELEIIIINDGSTDDSLAIIQMLAKDDNRIQIYNQLNQGQSVARNTGIAQATGKYLYFMDSDDFLDLNTLEECYNKCEKDNLDFVFFNAEVINEHQGSSFQMDYHHHSLKDRVYGGLEVMNFLIDTWQFKIPPYLNLIRTSYLRQINLLFYPGIIHEDQLFTVLLYTNATRVGYIDKDFFKRRIRLGSTMTLNVSWKNVTGYFTVFDELRLFAVNKEKSISNIIYKHIKITLNAFIYNICLTTFPEKRALLKLCIKKNYIKDISVINLFRLILPYHWISKKIDKRIK